MDKLFLFLCILVCLLLSVVFMWLILGCAPMHKPYENYRVIEIKKDNLEHKIYCLEQGFDMRLVWNEKIK